MAQHNLSTLKLSKSIVPKFIFMLVLISCIGSFGLVSAVECNADLSQGGNSCTVSSSLTLNGLPHNFCNSSITNNCIVMTTSNVVLNCNGSLISGNWSFGDNIAITGVKVNGGNNVTIKNCIFKNIWSPLEITTSNNVIVDNVTTNIFKWNQIASNVNNLTIKNSNFTNSSQNNLIFLSLVKGAIVDNNYFSQNLFGPAIVISSPGINNSIFSNNRFEGNLFTGFYTSNVFNTSFLNNSFQNVVMPVGGKAFYTVNGNNNSYLNNYFKDVNQVYYGWWAVNETNSTYSYNTFYNGTHWGNIFLTGSRLGYNHISYNNLTFIDLGINIFQSNNYIHNNIFNYSVMGFDGYYTSLKLDAGSSNNLVYNNSFYNCGYFCLFIRNSANNLVYNNYFDNLPVSQMNQNFSDYSYSTYDYTGAIITSPLLKTWVSDSTGVLHSTDNISVISQYVSDNNTIYNNTYGNNVQVYYSNVGGLNNLFLDAPNLNYWYRSFQFPVYQIPKTELYINNNFDNLTQRSWSGGIGAGTVGLLIQQGVANQFTVDFYVTKSYIKSVNNFRNLSDIRTVVHSYFNLTSALLTNGTSLCNGSTGLVIGNINITLNPNEECYVLNNYNITEGYTRANDPLFNGTYLNNTLTDTVTVSTYGITGFRHGIANGGSFSDSTGVLKLGSKSYAQV